MIKIRKDAFSQLHGSSLSQDRKFRARKKKLAAVISATSLSSVPRGTASVKPKRTKKRSRQRPGGTATRQSLKHGNAKALSDADFGREKNLGYSSFGAYSNNHNPHNNSTAAIAARKHQMSVAAARSAAQQHQTGKRFTADYQRVNSVPNLSQYVAPSQRNTLEQVPSGVHVPAPSATAVQESRKRAAKREAFALRTLAQHAGLGKTKVEFRSGRVAAEFALTQVTSSWRRDEEAAKMAKGKNASTVNSSAQKRLPSVKKIEQCLQALGMMPHHLAVVVRRLRRAIYSDVYTGVVAPETQNCETEQRDKQNSSTLVGLPYYAFATA